MSRGMRAEKRARRTYTVVKGVENGRNVCKRVWAPTALLPKHGASWVAPLSPRTRCALVCGAGGQAGRGRKRFFFS
jgi:hypothetical protein